MTPDPGSAPPAYSVAVVGNGPVSDEQRKAIATFPNVVRFNDMKSWTPGERVTMRAHLGPNDKNSHSGWTGSASLLANATDWIITSFPDEVPANQSLVTWDYKPWYHKVIWPWYTFALWR